MLGVGDEFPSITVTAVTADLSDPFRIIDTGTRDGRWLVLFAWPKDFTFVCPTELVAFGERYDQIDGLNADLWGVSIDSEYVHLAWRQHDEGIRPLPYPMLADVRRELCSALGILDRTEGVALRATVIVDPDGIIRFVSVNDRDVGRNVDEVLRVLQALQAGGLTACGWQPGDALLTPA
jgi:alkyl hydroperoxide reductase subunit AhpC